MNKETLSFIYGLIQTIICSLGVTIIIVQIHEGKFDFTAFNIISGILCSIGLVTGHNRIRKIID